jgi:hypothetical protein
VSEGVNPSTSATSALTQPNKTILVFNETSINRPSPFVEV